MTNIKKLRHLINFNVDVFDYIERFYNPKRRHSTLGYLSLMDYEKQAQLA